MRASLTLLILIPTLAGCRHQESDKKDASTFGKRLECARLSTSDRWDDVISGPFLDSTYYSPSLDTCVFVMKATHRGEKDGGIHRDVLLVDALKNKQIWANDPESGETEDQLTAKLNQELQKLQINP
jgi:hypothetical protein